MQIKSVKFIKSSPDLSSCPKTLVPEYAFAGRSNVGKSSLINMIVDRKKLAKTSGVPGKTKLINHFEINENWYLVDLPGYGYAKTSKKQRKYFNEFITEYLLKRKSMVYLFVLVDSRLEPQKIDLEFIEWLGINKIPFGICFTKIDKLTDNKVNEKLEAFKKELKKNWEELPVLFTTSARKGNGKQELLDFIENVNKTVNI